MAREEFPLERQLRKDIQDAQRARDQLKLDTLRMALGAMHNLEVARTDRKNTEVGQPLTEGDTLKVLEQEVKYKTARGRADAARGEACSSPGVSRSTFITGGPNDPCGGWPEDFLCVQRFQGARRRCAERV